MRAAAAATLAVACGGAPDVRTTEEPAEGRVVEARRSPPRALPSHPTDAAIADAVRRELAVDPAVDPERVRVRVDDGVVVLAGTVPHLLMADRAVERAKMVWGARAVVERLEVAPSERSDPAVAAEVRDALRIDPATEAYAVDVEVDEGVARLAGTVQSFAEKRLAERNARAVRGVRGVRNELSVEYPGERSDREIRADVVGALRADRWIAGWMIDVRVEDGVVELAGAQPTARTRERAIDTAQVMGVRAVEASGLTVQPQRARAMRRPPAGYEMPVDEEIHRAVTAALERHPRVSTRELDVDYDRFDGVVTLQGIVDTLAAHDAAAETAMTVRGVRRVDNRLIVDTDEADPARVAARIEERFESHPVLSDAAIAVQVRDGRATLRGGVGSLHARQTAEALVRQVPGVREVDNDLEAPPPAPTEGPSDHVLGQRIHARLVAHPYVDASRIEVDVVDGAVTLMGTVHDARAERAAMRVAREQGAVAVRDGLAIATDPARRTP
jgi:osmotically-inducible protein OsmY